MHTRNPQDLTTVDIQTFHQLVQDSHRLQSMIDEQARALDAFRRCRHVEGHEHPAVFITKDGLHALADIPWSEPESVVKRACRIEPSLSLDDSLLPSENLCVRSYLLEGYRHLDGRVVPVYREE